MDNQPEPKFVNRQEGTVTVFGPDKRSVHVQPYANRGRDPKGLYVVVGEHYRRFCGPRGPLYPFPESTADEANASQVRAGVRSAPLKQEDVDTACDGLVEMDDAQMKQALAELSVADQRLHHAVLIDLPRRIATRKAEAAAAVPTTTPEAPPEPDASDASPAPEVNPIVAQLVQEIVAGEDEATFASLLSSVAVAVAGEQDALLSEPLLRYKPGIDLLVAAARERELTGDDYATLVEQVEQVMGDPEEGPDPDAEDREEVEIPDFKEMTKRQILAWADSQGLTVTVMQQDTKTKIVQAVEEAIADSDA